VSLRVAQDRYYAQGSVAQVNSATEVETPERGPQRVCSLGVHLWMTFHTMLKLDKTLVQQVADRKHLGLWRSWAGSGALVGPQGLGTGTQFLRKQAPPLDTVWVRRRRPRVAGEHLGGAALPTTPVTWQKILGWQERTWLQTATAAVYDTAVYILQFGHGERRCSASETLPCGPCSLWSPLR
jgi:hypothetical protein